jgi:hypothetical protein
MVGGGRPQIIRFLGHSSVTLSRLNKPSSLAGVFIFFFSFAAIYTHRRVHIVTCCWPVCRPALYFLCVDGGASCTVIWERKKIFQSGGKGRALHTHTHTPLSSITNFLLFFLFFCCLRKKTALLMVLSRDAVNGMNMYMYTERTARNCHSCFSGLSVVRPNTTHERTGVKIYENYTHKGVCPAGMFSRAYSTSTCIYLPVCCLFVLWERGAHRPMPKCRPNDFLFRSRHL